MSDILTYYGGSLLALKGRDSVLMISDLRLGQGNITTNKNFTRIAKLSNLAMVGLASFVPDCQMLLKRIQKNVNLFHLNEMPTLMHEDSDKCDGIDAFETTNLVSYLLYSRRFEPYIVDPIVCGFRGTHYANASDSRTPLIASLDSLGCISFCNFAAAGTASDKLYGLCEALYEEDLDSEDLFVTGAQIFLNSVDRDALSGWN
ncbi:putative proteasome subunit beta type-3, partial [Dictyocoela roeselum]